MFNLQANKSRIQGELSLFHNFKIKVKYLFNRGNHICSDNHNPNKWNNAGET